MKHHKDIKQLHENIQKQIFSMLPEKWDRLYLYASVIELLDESQTGEMFFYYFPKGILKKRPVNGYEIPRKFNIDEAEYFKLADSLYNSIKKLRNECIKENEKAWSNVTIIIEKQKYKAIYGYENLSEEKFNIEARRVIWAYRYLGTPYESLNRKEREIIEAYEKMTKRYESTFELPIYTKSLNKKLKNIKDVEKQLEFVTEEKIEEMEFKKNHVPKSQILITK